MSNTDKQDRFAQFRVPFNPESSVRRVIAVGSGKGGVGKSTTTALLATGLQKEGYKVGILDADVTGPSIPQLFGVHEKARVHHNGLMPQITKTGIKIMSMNLILEDEESPAIWRGPVVGNLLKQFWSNVVWGDLDILLIDLPPGTSDVPLTIFQMIPVDGMLLVGSPQELVSVMVSKAWHMAGMMDVPLIGYLENYAYFVCPECGKKTRIFGESRAEEDCAERGIPFIQSLGINPKLARLCDEGAIEEADLTGFEPALALLSDEIRQEKE